MFFDSCLDSSQLIENCVLKSNRNKITVLQCFTIFFFDSSLNPFSHKLLLFFWSFYESKFQGFSSLTPSKSLLPFFFIELHAYMHFHQKISNFRTKEILGFLMFLSVLIRFVGWVFMILMLQFQKKFMISSKFRN